MPPTLSAERFEDIAGLELTPEIIAAFEADGIQRPTDVQLAAIPVILQGKHTVLKSGTGSGKTLAYLLPILQTLKQTPGSRAVCFAPSAELAVQTLEVAERYKAPGIRTAALVAGGSRRYAQRKLQKSTQLIVGTPGRVLEMFQARKLKGVTIMVLDEVEPILGNKDAAFLRELLSRPEPKVQLVLAAATFGVRANDWIADLAASDIARVEVDDDPMVDQIQHSYLRVPDESERDLVLSRFIEKHPNERAIVFVNSSNLIRHLYRVLHALGLKPATLSPERTKQQNQQALRDFKRSQARVLLTTDAAASGLDVADVPWVLHYELPHSSLAYVHRAGRTGRAGKSGHSIVLIGDHQRARLGKLASELNLPPFAQFRPQ